MVDVGCGIGAAISEIVKSYLHIKGINFDLPRVTVTAPSYPGVSHVGGDMFQGVPSADALFLKRQSLEAKQILRNCRKAIGEKNGKVIILDIFVKSECNEIFDEMGMVIDLLMLAHTSGGKERTEKEWKKILNEGGFTRYKIIKIQAILSIIEAYPE
nr:(R,S)-reticuline 7-O-methyltransferase-like [Ziziphus jujuba var. spinosa]